ncbi:indoleacetic acid-induced protein 8 [Striga asiatica]|uniref:Indoleacetic acid-induced protein 8 n=1 Tax=Striga asiatica TaxID=4170 RepID=A0A5A7Q4A3_STRAF|nr:indoleacetic acid-induced protein 8 [Striga asiatica]
MASTVDENFQPPMFPFVGTPKTAAAASEPGSPEEQLRLLHDGYGRNIPARGVGRKGFLGIDLNVAPPEDSASESPAAESGGDWVSEVSSGNRDEIRAAHSSEGELAKIEQAVTGSEKGKAKYKRWDALIEAAGRALRDFGGRSRSRDKEVKAPNRKRGEAEAAGGGPRRRIGGRGFAGGWDEFVAAPAVVVRSTRERVVAMPNKYRDSVLHATEAMAVAEVRFSRRKPR